MKYLSTEQTQQVEELEQEQEESYDQYDQYDRYEPTNVFHHPEPDSRPPFPPAQGRPAMEFFGPKDYVPEVPHLVPKGSIYLPHGGDRRQNQPDLRPRTEYLQLEPKPRYLHNCS